MFPWVYGFQWTPAHLIFTGIFMVVAFVVGVTVALAFFRTLRAFRNNNADAIRWQAEFHDLPAEARACRHAITGELPGRQCERGFDCRRCEKHAAFEMPPAPDRLYHRGHTWVEREPAGTVLISLDRVAERLIGTPDEVVVPDPGAHLKVNSPAFRLRKNGTELRVLSPVDGAVVETNPSGEGWLARVQPAEPFDDSHLLRGVEAQAWMRCEVDRLVRALTPVDGVPTMADGGEMVQALAAVRAPAQWDAACGEILLEP